MSYLYETHLHTAPVSKCARADVRDSLEFYRAQGYAGVFLTNHFLDGNINVDKTLSYRERLDFYFSDYHKGVELSEELGIAVFLGVELSYRGTDFLVYGLDEAWFYAHPEIEQMKKTEELALMAEAGALIVQAHPFREDKHINHIRLFPRHVHGIESYNACRTDFENEMAELYAARYGLLTFAGTDNHRGGNQILLGGMQADTPLADEADFVRRVFAHEMRPFRRVAE